MWDGGLQQAADLRCERGSEHCVDMLAMVWRLGNAGSSVDTQVGFMAEMVAMVGDGNSRSLTR